MIFGFGAKKVKGAIHSEELAATKACFNVLGYPFEYRSKKEYVGKDGQRLVLPEPKAFLNGQYTINQLANLLTDLDIACNTLKERTEMQVKGSVFASLVGAETTGRDGRREEPAKLRELAAEKAMMGQKADLAKCFKTGLVQNPYDPRDSVSLCDGTLRRRTFSSGRSLIGALSDLKSIIIAKNRMVSFPPAV